MGAKMNRDELMSHLEARLKDNPKSLIFARLADLYLEDKRIPEAIQLCTEGLKNHPSYVTGHFILAKAYLANQENENAETSLKNVLSHDREYLSAYLLLGDLMKNMGWENKAATYYREILAIDPSENMAKERLSMLSEATTWDFSVLEEEQAGANIEDVAIEDVEEEDWVNDIREVFPDEISADVSPIPPVQKVEIEQPAEEELKETLQDLDTFLDDQSSQPISETPEFFAITDSEQNAPDSAKPDVGPEEEKIATEFLGEERASETIQNIEKNKTPEDAESALITESSQEDISETIEETVTADFLDSQDIITEQDFEEALGVFDELDSGIESQKKEEAVSPQIVSEDQDIELEDNGIAEETVEPAPEEKEEPETDSVEKTEDSFDLSVDLMGEDNLSLTSDETESKPIEETSEESTDQDWEKAVQESPPTESPAIESETEPLSEEDKDFGFSGLGEFISEQPSAEIPKSPPPVKHPPEEVEKTSPVTEEIPTVEEKSEPKLPKETPLTEPSAPTPEETVEDQAPQEQAPPRRIITSTLGAIYAAQGQYDKAIAVYEELLEQNPEITQYKEKIEEFRKKLNEAGQ